MIIYLIVTWSLSVSLLCLPRCGGWRCLDGAPSRDLVPSPCQSGVVLARSCVQSVVPSRVPPVGGGSAGVGPRAGERRSCAQRAQRATNPATPHTGGEQRQERRQVHWLIASHSIDTPSAFFWSGRSASPPHRQQRLLPPCRPSRCRPPRRPPPPPPPPL